jgi:hypothetical protein
MALLLAATTASATMIAVPVERPAINTGTGVLIGYSLLISANGSGSPGNAVASVFAGPTILWFDGPDVGSTFSLSSVDPGFNEFVAALSDGVDNDLLVTLRRDFDGDGTYITSHGIFSDYGTGQVAESVIFGGLTQTQLASITRVDFTVDAFGNGGLDAAGTFSFIPEPGTALLLGLGLVGLASRRRTRALALVLPFALLIGAESASARSSDPFQIVGVTSTSHLGGEGVRTFTLACQADYGPAARMCTSEEVLQTVVWPVIEADAWVRPVFVSTSGIGGAEVDVSGVKGDSQYMSCYGWNDSTINYSGMTVTTAGAIRFSDVMGNGLRCDVPRRVACCKRVPEPSAALSLPIGALGLAGLAAMKGSV